jgi:hypothetical protein
MGYELVFFGNGNRKDVNFMPQLRRCEYATSGQCRYGDRDKIPVLQVELSISSEEEVSQSVSCSTTWTELRSWIPRFHRLLMYLQSLMIEHLDLMKKTDKEEKRNDIMMSASPFRVEECRVHSAFQSFCISFFQIVLLNTACCVVPLKTRKARQLISV